MAGLYHFLPLFVFNPSFRKHKVENCLERKKYVLSKIPYFWQVYIKGVVLEIMAAMIQNKSDVNMKIRVMRNTVPMLMDKPFKTALLDNG